MEILYNTITNCEYPKPPVENAEKSRMLHRLDYVALLKDGLLPFKTGNTIKEIPDIEVDGVLCQYYGQVDRETFTKPDGIGLVVNQHGFIMEGHFNDGVLEPTCREFIQYEEDGTWLWKTLFYINEEKGYAVTYKKQYVDNGEPAFYKGSTLVSEGYDTQTYWREDEEALLTQFDYRKYFVENTPEDEESDGQEEDSED